MAGPSNPQLPWVDNYDVFLSFRGPDTRNGFTDYLYHGLKGAGIRVFLDERELTYGKRLDEELPQAIDNSRIYIPVLSETYASSKWCLRELARMVRNYTESEGNKEILPVFYRVTTDDVKLRTDLYKNQLAAHGITTEVEEWKKSLQCIPELRGWQLPSSRLSEAKVCRDIIKQVSDMLKGKHNALQYNANVFRSSRWEEIMEEIVTSLKDDRINVIGLYGMGGVGKTTMINEVRHRVLKEGLFNEVPKAVVTKDVDIPRIQEEIAHELGLKLENKSPNINAGLLSKRLLQKKTVLIILDDLWEKLDLQNVGIPSSAANDKEQIKLLLTSRNQLLLSDKMASQKLLHLNVLNEEDALRMFKFFVGDGAEGVKADKETEIARKCSGLPLVIETIANALKNKDQDEWEKTLNRLDNDNVLEKLRVSYDYLPRKESKDIFLLCGIIRGPLIRVKDLLKYTFGLGLYQGKRSIHTLTDAATELKKLLVGLEAASMLLKNDDSCYVKIHDRMRDLAVEIVDKDRLEWAHDLNLSDDSSYKLPRKFQASKLELLFSYWYCELKGDSQLQVPVSFFKDMKELYVLEFTNLRGALSPTTQLDYLGNLGTLCLRECSLTGDISMIGDLKRLQILSFQGSDIRKLPIQLRELTALRMLDLSDCWTLKQIEPTVLGSLVKLEELNMTNSFSDWEIDQEGNAPPSNARLIELNSMSRLSNVRIHIPSTSMLPKECRLFSSKLTMYQIILGCRRWMIGGHEWRSFIFYKFSRVLILKFDSPDILQQDWVQATLQMAEFLYLDGRQDVKCESNGELCVKGFECLKYQEVRECPSIRYIFSSNCGSFRTLESLELTNCDKLTHLFDEDDKKEDVVTLLKLRTLKLARLPKLSSFCKQPRTPSKALFSGKKEQEIFPYLETLELSGLDELVQIWPHEVVAAQTSFYMLKTVRIHDCPKLSAVFPSTMIERLQKLEYIQVWNCESMRTIVVDIGQRGGPNSTEEMFTFPCLRQLDLWSLPKIDRFYSSSGTPFSFNFPSLETLQIEECPGVTTLFTQRPNGLVEAGDHDSDGVGAAFFGYFHKLDKSIPNLKSLTLEDLKNLTEIWKGQSDENCSALELEKGDYEFCFLQLESLTLYDLPKLECNIFVYEKKCSINNKLPHILFPSLQELTVVVCNMVQVQLDNSESSNDNQVQLDTYTAIEQFIIYSVTSPLRTLHVNCGDSRVELNMEEEEDDLRLGLKRHLDLWLGDCSSVTNLQSLLPVASPSFCNVLTKLEVTHSHGLVYILTPLGATSLVHLTCLEIRFCRNIKQVVAEEADNEKGGGDDLREITFNHLKELTLGFLESLESFSSVNNNNLVLNFPSLEELTIQGCPKMRIFSNGVLTTPKLQQLRWGWRVSRIQLCGGDLNRTIQKIYTGEQQVSTSSVVSDSQAQLSGDPNTNIQELDTGDGLLAAAFYWIACCWFCPDKQ